MNAASLPYALMLLLAETAAGAIACTTVFDARGQVTRGYVKAAAITVVPLAVCAAWIALVVAPSAEVGGYPLDSGALGAVRATLVALVGATAMHFVAAMRDARRAAVLLGAVSGAAGVAALAALSALVAPAAWSGAGVFVSLVASAAVLGTALMAMMWGHWYLTSGRLPKEPMEQMALVVVGAIALQAVVVVAGSLIEPRQVPLSEGFGVGLAQNPAFWLRVTVGLAFPAVLSVLAWRAATIRGMMSATGLLYIALGTVLAGEALARGLLFSTGLTV